jgi:AcrR family transcriptional regulator
MSMVKEESHEMTKAQDPAGTGRDDDETAAVMRLLWGQRPTSHLGPKPALSVDLIAKTAMEIADRDGLQSVTMQRVAQALHFTKMALYRHIRSRDELIAIMIEEAVGEPPDLRGVRGGWRARLTKWADALWTRWASSPWLPGVTTGSRPMGPRELRWTEAAFVALEGTPLATADKSMVVSAVSSYVRGCKYAIAGTQVWNVQPAIRDYLRAALEENRSQFPLTLAADVEVSTATGSKDWRRGLGYVLDGVERLITRAESERARPGRSASGSGRAATATRRSTARA